MGCEGVQTVAIDTTLSSFAVNGEEHCWQPEQKQVMRVARVCLMLVVGGWVDFATRWRNGSQVVGKSPHPQGDGEDRGCGSLRVWEG